MNPSIAGTSTTWTLLEKRRNHHFLWNIHFTSSCLRFFQVHLFLPSSYSPKNRNTRWSLLCKKNTLTLYRTFQPCIQTVTPSVNCAVIFFPFPSWLFGRLSGWNSRSFSWYACLSSLRKSQDSCWIQWCYCYCSTQIQLTSQLIVQRNITWFQGYLYHLKKLEDFVPQQFQQFERKKSHRQTQWTSCRSLLGCCFFGLSYCWWKKSCTSW